MDKTNINSKRDIPIHYFGTSLDYHITIKKIHLV